MGTEHAGTAGARRTRPVRRAGLRRHHRQRDRRAGRRTDQDDLLPALPRQAGGAVRGPGHRTAGSWPTRSPRRPARPRRSRPSPRPSTPSPPPSPTTGASSPPGCSRSSPTISELRERAAFKHIGLTEAMAEALEKRGVPDLTASLAAELGIRAFDRAFGQWADPAGRQTLTELDGPGTRRTPGCDSRARLELAVRATWGQTPGPVAFSCSRGPGSSAGFGGCASGRKFRGPGCRHRRGRRSAGSLWPGRGPRCCLIPSVPEPGRRGFR